MHISSYRKFSRAIIMEMLTEPHDSVQKKKKKKQFFHVYSPAFTYTPLGRRFAIWCFNYSYLIATQTYQLCILSHIRIAIQLFTIMNSRIFSIQYYDRAHQVSYSLDWSTHHARRDELSWERDTLGNGGVELHLLCLLVAKWKTVYFIQCCISSFMSLLSHAGT